MHRMFADAGRARVRSSFLPAFACVTVVLAAVLMSVGADRPLSTVDTVPASATAPDAGWFEHDAPEPRRVRSDAVGIDAPTIPLGKRDDGALEVPEDAHTAGWWTGRANPGERGPAVIVGHVDSREGPGAFWELPELEVGDRVSVDREDGTSVHWRVDRVEQHAKDAFPTEAVYGATDEPTLRLVTCSGFFDRDARSYTDNTIVFLRLDDEQDFVPERPGAADEGAVRRVEPDGPPAASSYLGVPVSLAEAADRADGRRVPIIVAAMSLLVASATLGRAWGGARGAAPL
jgi:hypothetical protein